MAGVHLHAAAGRVHVGVDGAVAERNVRDDLVHLHGMPTGATSAAVLLPQLLGRLHPFVAQERVLVCHGVAPWSK